MLVFRSRNVQRASRTFTSSGSRRVAGSQPGRAYSLTAQKLDLIKQAPLPDIIYEDKDFLFLNKPAGLATSGTEDSELSLHDIVKEYGFRRFNYRPGVLFRLDKVSAGLVVFAKNKAAETFFQGLLPSPAQAEGQASADRGPGISKITSKDKSKEKRPLESRSHGKLVRGELALVHGSPNKPDGTVKGGMIKTVGNPRRFSIVSRGGHPAVVNFARAAPSFSLKLPPDAYPKGRQLIDSDTVTALCLRGRTGRRQEVRAACSALGTPIVGDVDYGGAYFAPMTAGAIPKQTSQQAKTSQVLLHSSFIAFPSMDGVKYYKIFLMPAWPESLLGALAKPSDLELAFDSNFLRHIAPSTNG